MTSTIYGSSANDGMFKAIGPFQIFNTGSTIPVQQIHPAEGVGKIHYVGKLINIKNIPINSCDKLENIKPSEENKK